MMAGEWEVEGRRAASWPALRILGSTDVTRSAPCTCHARRCAVESQAGVIPVLDFFYCWHATVACVAGAWGCWCRARAPPSRQEARNGRERGV